MATLADALAPGGYDVDTYEMRDYKFVIVEDLPNKPTTKFRERDIEKPIKNPKYNSNLPESSDNQKEIIKPFHYDFCIKVVDEFEGEHDLLFGAQDMKAFLRAMPQVDNFKGIVFYREWDRTTGKNAFRYVKKMGLTSAQNLDLAGEVTKEEMPQPPRDPGNGGNGTADKNERDGNTLAQAVLLQNKLGSKVDYNVMTKIIESIVGTNQANVLGLFKYAKDSGLIFEKDGGYLATMV